MADSSGSGKKGKSGGFQSLGLSANILGGILKMGYKVPTPIQRKTLPIALSGRDLVAMARTGSGKTASFLIPMLERLKEHSSKVGCRGLVLSPTRELAMQTAKFLKDMAKYTTLRYTLLVGGDSMEQQFEALTYNPDIIIATPGRLMHHLMEVPHFTLSLVEMVVFDEADRLFELGFAEQLKEIMAKVSPDRQTMLFSATMPQMLAQFTRAGLKNPEMMRLDVETKVSENLRLAFFIMRQEEKLAMLVWLFRELLPPEQQAMVFCATRQAVDYVTTVLRKTGITTEAIYGSMEQTTRTGNLAKFRNRKCRVLVVTDVAARGIDIPLLDNVVNFDFPDKPKLFVHRTGRVARQGRIGTAFSFLVPTEMSYVLDLHLFLSRSVSFDDKTSYSLATMSPSDVHCGCIPRKLLDAEIESLRGFHNSNEVEALAASAINSYKMYAKTRADASKRSVQRAKELNVDFTHPLFGAYVSAGDKELESFRKQLASFRPSQVILEVEGTKKDKAGLVDMMKKKRQRDQKVIKQQDLKRRLADGGSVLRGADEARFTADAKPHGGAGASDSDSDDREDDEEGEDVDSDADTLPATPKQTQKRELPSYMKKAIAAEKKAKQMSFRDESQFISAVPGFDKSDVGFEIREAVSGGGRAGLSGAGLGNSHDISGVALFEDAVLDMMPDETTEMFAKRRVSHWDRRKKKFVQVSAAESAQAHLKGKRIRTESGALVAAGKREHGELYKKWQKHSHRRVESVGAEEEDNASGPSTKMDWRAGKRKGARGFGSAFGNMKSGSGRGGGGGGDRDRSEGGGRRAKNEVKSTAQVVKERKMKLNKQARINASKKGGSRGRR